MNNPRFVWVAVDSNGDERITSNEEGFQRFSPSLYHRKYDMSVHQEHLEEVRKVISFNDTVLEYDHWIEYHDPGTAPKTGYLPSWIYLPKGSIEKLLGRKLTWEDEPVKIESF